MQEPLLAAALLLARAASAVTMPEREAFWFTPPASDPQTVALWTFDGDGGVVTGGGDDALGDLLAAAALGTGEAAALPGAGRSGGLVESEAAGTVGSTADGFFGKAAVLDGRGFLRSKSVRFGECAQASIELQVRPEAGQGEATLLDFPSAAVPCRIVRAAGGALALEGRDGARLAHPRAAPDEVWTHVALSFPRGGGIELLVDGLAAAPEEAQRRAFPAAPAQLGSAFVVGARADGGEAGRFRGRVDTVRVLARAANLYVLEEMPQADPALPPPPSPAPPWFAYARAPLLSIPFDGAGEAAAGVAAVQPPSAFIAGIRGGAASLAAADCAFAGDGILPAARGTLSLWFRPLDWNNFAQYCQYGNDGPVPRFRLLSFVPADAPADHALRTLTLGKGIQQPQHGLPRPWVPFHPGRWTHLVCAWDGERTALYLDGKKQALGQAAWGASGRNADARKALEAAWRDGGAARMRLVFHRSGTAVDAVALYPWSFTDEEAANDYVRPFPDAAERMVALEPIRLTPEYDYYNRRLTVAVHALPRADREPDAVRVAVRADGQAIAGAAAEAALPLNGRTRLTMPAPLAFDQPYTLHAETFIGGAPVAACETPYTRTAPVWWRNTLGQTREVPPPWTPVAVTGEGRLDVWGRTLTLAPGGLPATLASAGAELLAAPFRLHGALAGGAAVELQGAAVPLVAETAADRARWSGTLAGGGITVAVEGELAYDGLIRLRLTLRPDGGPVAFERLDLDVPLRAAHAGQVIANGGGRNFRASWDARLVPPGDGRVWNGREAIQHKAMAVGHFLPVVWLGDDQRGLCFFSENDRGWTPHPGEASQELWRDGATVRYRMRLFSRPLTLDAPRTIEFFVHPTPTKPLPERWRAYNRGEPPVPNYEGIDAFISPTLTAPSNLPTHAGITFELEPHSWEDAAANSGVLRGRAGRPGSPRLFYIDYSWPRLGPSMAEFTRAGLFARGRMTWTREVEDYMVWIIHEYIRRDLIDGIYIDDTSLGSTIMTEATAYRLDDGTVQPGFSTMGFRRFLQRIWNLYAAQGRRARIMPHMTYCYEIPALSFADAVVNGEDRDIYPYAKVTFPDRWPYEQLRVLSGSEKFGFVHFWKAGVDPNKAETPRGLPEWLFWQNRAMKGWLMLQDTEVMWGAKVGAKELLAFGAHESDARFVRHEEASAWFRGAPAPVRVAAYLRDRRALVVVFNPEGEERTVTLDPDTQGFFRGATAFAWRDAESDLLPPGGGPPTREELGEATKLKNRGLSLDGPALDAAAIDDLLDPKTPQEKERERLAVAVDAGRAILPVRGKDFRLLLLSWQAE